MEDVGLVLHGSRVTVPLGRRSLNDGLVGGVPRDVDAQNARRAKTAGVLAVSAVLEVAAVSGSEAVEKVVYNVKL